MTRLNDSLIEIIVTENEQVLVIPGVRVTSKRKPLVWSINQGSAKVFYSADPSQSFDVTPQSPASRVMTDSGVYCILVRTPAAHKVGAMAVVIIDP